MATSEWPAHHLPISEFSRICFSLLTRRYVCGRVVVDPSVCKYGPPYSPYLLKFKANSNYSNYPYGPQDDKYSYHNGARLNAIKMFNSTQLPIKTAVAKEFAVFNHLHSSVPSYSTPNHLFWGYGSSCGLSTNPRCNATSYEPPAHIFDSLHAANVSYRSYANSSSGACASDLGLKASQRHKDHCFSMGQFFEDAADVRASLVPV